MRLRNWLAGLTPEEADRVLTQPIMPYGDDKYDDVRCGQRRCLVQVVQPGVSAPMALAVALHQPTENELIGHFNARTRRTPAEQASVQRYERWLELRISPGYAYEALCERFGAARINAAIRQRLLRLALNRLPAPAHV
jgi:hypothetical protein